LGPVVEEYQEPTIRKIIFGNYRIIYRFDGTRIEILTIYHGARLLGDNALEKN